MAVTTETARDFGNVIVNGENVMEEMVGCMQRILFCVRSLYHDHPSEHEEEQAHGVDGEEDAGVGETCAVEEVHRG